MSLSTGRTRLVASLKELHLRWDRVTNRWDDQVAKSFAEEFLDPLDARIRAGVTAIEEMDELITRIKRDCM